jgi:hypothetical protein
VKRQGRGPEQSAPSLSREGEEVYVQNNWKVTVPEGTAGEWSVQRFTVRKEDIVLQFGDMLHGRFVPPGDYTRLVRGHTVVMSDTPDERRDHAEVIYRARGRVFLAGLGLGCVLQEVALKEEVEQVTVVEKSREVIDLVWPHYRERFGAERIRLYEADVFEFPLGTERYELAWFDIWDGICSDNLEDMKRLTRKFGRHAYWKGSWGRSHIESERRAERMRGGSITAAMLRSGRISV